MSINRAFFLLEWKIIFLPHVFLFCFFVLSVQSSVSAQESSVVKQQVIGQKDKTGKLTSRNQPWLQFAVPGHTSAVKVLAFSPDGNRLYSGGEDKILHIWKKDDPSRNIAPETLAVTQSFDILKTAAETKGLPTTEIWTEMRAVRWPVGRSYWGNIYALAVGEERVLFGGHAASSHRKQLWAVDSVVGDFEFIKYPDEPSYHIIDICLFPDEKKAAILLIDGTVEIWEQRQNDWYVSKQIHSPDSSSPVISKLGDKKSQEDYARLLFNYRRQNTLQIFNDTQLIYPVLHRINTADRNLPIWRLCCSDISTGKSFELPQDFHDAVSTVAVCRSTGKFAASDQRGMLLLWDTPLREAHFTKPKTLFDTPAKRTLPVSSIISLAFSIDGEFLFGGTSKNIDGNAFLYCWEMTNTSLCVSRKLSEKVSVCSISPHDDLIAFSQQNDIHLASPKTLETKQVLGSVVKPVTCVAFAKDSYHFAIGYDATMFSATFHPSTTTWEELDKTDLKNWQMTTGAHPERWELHYDRVKNRYWIEKNGDQQVFAYLPINPLEEVICYSKLSTEKNLNAIYWICDATGRARYLIIGTSHPANEIVVFDLTQKKHSGEVAVIRRFSGHSGTITSLSVSFDQKYLLSGSYDGTVRIWDISNFHENDPIYCRWGMKAEIKRLEHALVITQIEETSPLFMRGVRKGSIIREVVPARPDGKRESLLQPEKMVRYLGIESLWNTQTGFVIEIEPGVIQQFATSPAQREMASFFAVQQTGDFAFWTPSGYFTASADAPNHFGWLCNQGIRGKPEFISAMAFKDVLESRPVMQNLLEAGSLEKTIDRLNRLTHSVQSDMPSPDVQYDLLFADRPSIEIRFPRTPKELNADRIRVEANVVFHQTDDMEQPRMFVNGIKAPPADSQTVASLESGQTQIDYVWEAVPLPSDPNILVKATIKSKITGITVGSMECASRSALKPPLRPKLYLFAIGVDYTDTDSLFPELPGVPKTVAQFRDDIVQWSRRIYDVETAVLLNQDATLPKIRKQFNSFLSENTGRIHPDDILIVYLAGHGTLDVRSGCYYYATFDAEFDHYSTGDYHNSLGFDDLLPLSDLPCKRIVFLETCQFAPQELKDPMQDYRRLEDEQFILVTAAEPGKSAIWTDDNTIGRFSKYLFSGWKGQADAFSPHRKKTMDDQCDGKVTINEIHDYLYAKLKDENRISSHKQQIEIFNKILLRFIDIPLSEYDNENLREPGVRSIVAPRTLPTDAISL